MSKSPPRSSCHATYRTPTESTARDTSPCADPAVPVSSPRELAPKDVAPSADVARYTFAFPVRLSWYATWMRPREVPTAEGLDCVAVVPASSSTRTLAPKENDDRKAHAPRMAPFPLRKSCPAPQT